MIPNEIQKIRYKCGLTQREFSDVLRIPLQTVKSWEQNRRSPPDYVTRLIKHYFGITTD